MSGAPVTHPPLNPGHGDAEARVYKDGGGVARPELESKWRTRSAWVASPSL